MAQRGRPKKERPNYDAAKPEHIKACADRVFNLMSEITLLQDDIKAVLEEYEQKHAVDSRAIRAAVSLRRKLSSETVELTKRKVEYFEVCDLVSWDSRGQGSFADGLDRAA